jgi:hypothetical protein
VDAVAHTHARRGETMGWSWAKFWARSSRQFSYFSCLTWPKITMLKSC